MRIALDAMGGDFGSDELIVGAALAVSSSDLQITLVGDRDHLAEQLDSLVQDKSARASFQIVHAPHVVGMHEHPVDAVRRKPDSSIMVAFELARAGNVDAVVSAGNSGATLAAGMRKLGRIPNVSRPGIASVFPTLKKPVVLMDIGANVDCKPIHLFQFAVMATAYSTLQGIETPRVGLLSIGAETGKGNSLVKETYEMLDRSPLNFIGNVEGRDVFTGDVDVIVCDGFVGNNVLKVSEGLADAIMKMMQIEIGKSLLAKIGFMLAKPSLRHFKKRVDYTEYGGAPLLGINGTGIICHGSSNAHAIKNAVLGAVRMVENNVNARIASDLENFHLSVVNE